MYPVIIIAEAGVNHNGDLNLAFELIERAKAAQADYVKFQTFIPENVMTKHAVMADYQKENTGKAESQLEMVRRLQISFEDHQLLIDKCNKTGIKFLSTGFDLESLDFLSAQAMDFVKVPSGEITNLPYLRKVAQFKRPVILSTGMATMKEVSKAIDVLIRLGVNRDEITALHCTTQYPAPFEDVNLKAMLSMAKTQQVAIGYSDHTPGIEVAIAAVALGATIIEKHFTLDNNLPGPDHRASLEPTQLTAMVSAVRHIEKALGSEEKRPSPSEINNIPITRKSIVARQAIKKGALFTEENLTVKRPGTGRSPMDWDQVLGSAAERDYEADDLI